MATDSERMSILETRLDGFIEETRNNFTMVNERFNTLESRINVQIQLTVAMWVTTMAGVIATLAAVLLKT